MASSSSNNPSTRSGQASGATSMAELMARHSAKPINALKKGDYVKGILTKLNKREMLVDIQAKGEAIVLEHDPKMLRSIQAFLKEGQEVEVSIISPESESGQPVVSLRRFIQDIVWKELETIKKNQDKVDVTINEVTKGGFVVSTHDGQSGFLPNSHSNASQGALSVGKTIQVTIADLNREDNKIIFSQKITMTPEEFSEVTKEFTKGTKVKGEISSVTTFGYFVMLHPKSTDKTIDGLIHVSEISWDRVEDPLTLYKVGQEVEVVVIGTDRDSRRVDLSFKRLTSDPFEKLKEEYPVDKQITAKVARTEDGNVYLDLGDPSTGSGQGYVEGLIKKEKIPPMTTYEAGQNVTATVTSHDMRRRRIELTPGLKEKPLM